MTSTFIIYYNFYLVLFATASTSKATLTVRWLALMEHVCKLGDKRPVVHG